MIHRVCRKLIAALLILGWVSLSCIDVVEDLDQTPGQVAVSSAPDHSGSSSKRREWGPLANNIVESANHTEEADVALASLTKVIFDFDPILHCRRYLQLHKFYRVVLI
jgi:hypothetical protein